MSTRQYGSAPGVRATTVANRFGIKGADAAAWLAQQGIAVPGAPNCATHWTAADSGTAGRCLRLGSTEFLVEEDSAPAAGRAAPAASARAWLLLREDFSLLLDGPLWAAELAQACSFDFTRLHHEPDMVVMTLLAGISVTLVREPSADPSRLALRLWCDASHARYLQECLQHIAQPLPPSAGDSR